MRKTRLVFTEMNASFCTRTRPWRAFLCTVVVQVLAAEEEAPSLYLSPEEQWRRRDTCLEIARPAALRQTFPKRTILSVPREQLRRDICCPVSLHWGLTYPVLCCCSVMGLHGGFCLNRGRGFSGLPLATKTTREINMLLHSAQALLKRKTKILEQPKQRRLVITLSGFCLFQSVLPNA